MTEMQHGEVSTGGIPYTDDGIADFTPTHTRVRFKVGDDVFTGKRDIPTMVAMRFAAKAATVEDLDAAQVDDAAMAQMIEIVRMMLTKESADLFVERLDDEENPIGIGTFTKLIPWLMEQYGMRPMEPSLDSQDGSPSQVPTTRSTETLPLAELTSSPSGSTRP